MAKGYADFLARVQDILQDNAEALTALNLQRFIMGDAAAIYSQDRPQVKVADTAGNGTAYLFALPIDWVADFSRILSVEFPKGNDPVDLLEDDDWAFYWDLVGGVITQKLRLIGIIPTAAQSIRLTYTMLHSIPATGNATTPDGDFEAICNLAASFCYRALAAKYAQSNEPAISADVVNWGEKGSIYTELADKLLELYKDHVGKGEGDVKAASKTQDLDTKFAWGGDFIFHHRKWR